MTNPNNAIGTNAAYSGRTSVNAFNDVLQCFTGRGILTGFGLRPGTGMSVSVGGTAGTRDVAIAEDNIGNFTTINNISVSPVSVSLPAAPSANSRVDAIVAYVTNPPQGSASAVDNPGACGIIPVSGAVAASPATPTESMIRAAISADGGSGSNAYYVVLGYAQVPAGTTDVTADMLSAAPHTQLDYVGDGGLTLNASGAGAGSSIYFSANQSNDTTVTPVWGTSNIGNSSITYAKMANDAIHTAEIQDSAVTTAKLASGAVTNDKIDWSTVNGGHDWKFGGRTVLTSASTEISVKGVGGHKNYKYCFEGEQTSLDEAWLDIRVYKNGALLKTSWARYGLHLGTTVSQTDVDGNGVCSVGLNRAHGVNICGTSFYGTGGGWRAWNFYAGGQNTALVGGAHIASAERDLDEIRGVCQGNFSAGTVLEVWYSD